MYVYMYTYMYVSMLTYKNCFLSNFSIYTYTDCILSLIIAIKQ